MKIHYCYLVALLVKHLFALKSLYPFAGTFSLKEGELNRFHLCAFGLGLVLQLIECNGLKGRIEGGLFDRPRLTIEKLD